MKQLLWIKKSFEYRGKASARKLTTFTSFTMLCLGFINSLHTHTPVQVEYIYLFGIITLIGLGYMTAENIVDLVKGRYNGQNIFTDNTDVYGNRHGIDNPDGV